MPSEETLTSTKAAALLHVSPQTVRDWSTTGKLTATTSAGGHRRYDQAEVYRVSLSERGFTTYWLADARLALNAAGEVDVELPDPLPTHNSRELRTLRLLPLLAGLAMAGWHVRDVEPADIRAEGEVAVLYPQAYALTAEQALAKLHAALPVAAATLRANARPKPVRTVSWHTPSGELIPAW